jgi:protein involved in polysaccharide export with SLBB domain
MGCEEHRITLDEFLIIQDEMKAKAEPPPAPSSEELAQIRSMIDEQLGPYRVGPRDVLMITVTGIDEATSLPSIQARVDKNGEIDLPQVGKLHVAGEELVDVEHTIQSAYVPKYLQSAAVHVTLIEPENTEVLVRGAVTTPGLVPLRRTERNPLFAIVAAGGVSSLASGDVTVKRLRRPDEVVTVNLNTPEGLREALALDPLEDGDVLEVHAAVPNEIFVGGLVMAPSPQVLLPGTQRTVLQALAAAGGLRTDVFPTEGTLVRHMPDGSDVQVKLDLNRIATGKDPNLALVEGDILWVPHTAETRIQEWINQNIFFRAGVSATAGANYQATALEYMNDNAKRASQNYSSGTLQDRFDPFGFLLQNQTLNQLSQ